MAGQRKNYLSWDEYFMSIVALASLRSVYKSSGACLVDSQNKILSIGSNQAPYSVYDRIPVGLHNYVLSPASNALFTFKGRRSEFAEGTIYLSDFPTPEDAKNLAQARLQRVVYLNDVKESEEKDISRIILDKAQIDLVSYMGDDYSDYSEADYHEFLTELQTLIKKYLKKENGPISSEEYYMGVAVLSALRCKDPSTQVGACLVDENGRIISVGYNGAPYGMSDHDMPWHSNGEQTGKKIDIKNNYVIHAEVNALDNYRGQMDDLSHMKLYLTLSPCEECTKRLSIASPKEIIWLRDFGKIDPSEYSDWFSKTNTDYHVYDPNMGMDKASYKEFIDEATMVLKKGLGKPSGSMR